MDCTEDVELRLCDQRHLENKKTQIHVTHAEYLSEYKRPQPRIYESNFCTDERKGHIEELKKTCICINKEGSPQRFLLKTERELMSEDEMIKRCTFGKKNNSEKSENRTIMLVGEEGTGKTTLINSLINYFLGVTKEDNVWFEITDEKDDQIMCRMCLTVYEVFFEILPVSWFIIDTPGYGSIQDTIIVGRLLKLLKYETLSIHAIGFVVTSTLNRLDDQQLYIFNAAQSLFGKDLKKNIVVFITHAGESTHHNVLTAIEKANVPVAKDENNEPIHFLYDNIQSDRENTYDDLYKAKWEMGRRSTKCFIASLETFGTVSLEMTKAVLTHRQALEFSVISLKECIQCIESKQKNLEKICNDLDKIREEEDFLSDYVVVEQQPIEGQQLGLTSHQPTMNKCCKVFHCATFYTRNENTSDKEDFTIIAVNRTIEENEKRGSTKSNKKENLKKEVETELIAEKERTSKLLDEAYDLIIKLEETALKEISVFTLVHLEFLIERLKETTIDNTEKVRKLEELMSVDENTQRALRYYRYLKSEEKKIAMTS